MTPGRNRHRLLPVMLLGCVICNGADRWQPLVERNPFVAYQPPVPPPPEPPPPYEFRGRSVENGVEYFSLYNLETKKAFWVGRTGGGNLRVQEYNPANGLVLADHSGRIIRLDLKKSAPGSGGLRLRAGTALASASSRQSIPVMAVPVNASESSRLEQVAEQIRARRAQRLQTVRVRS